VENGIGLFGNTILMPDQSTQNSNTNNDTDDADKSTESSQNGSTASPDNKPDAASYDAATKGTASSGESSPESSSGSSNGSAIVAKLEAFPQTFEASLASTPEDTADILEQLARKRTLDAIAEAKQLSMLEMLKNPPMAPAQVTVLFQDTPANKPTAPVKVTPTEAL